MDAVLFFGTPLIDDPHRFGTGDALGLDETLFCRQGRWRTQAGQRGTLTSAEANSST